MNVPKVGFMIAGAQKSGTSALAAFCADHPDICMASPKEPHVFDATNFNVYERNTTSLDQSYSPFFDHYDGEKILGEATPIYMFLPEVAERLYMYNPELKLVIILRDPVDRAVSHYSMSLGRDDETRTLLAALFLEPFRIWRDRGNRQNDSSIRNHSYAMRGNYRLQLERLLNWFDRKQILVLTSDQLLHEHNATLAKLFHFLGLDDTFLTPARSVFSSEGWKPSNGLRRFLQIVFWRQRQEYKRVIQDFVD